MIVVLLIALLITLVVPSIQSLGSARLRSESARMIGLIRDSFARAALSGQTYRIVFDLDDQSYWLESSSDAVALSQDMEKDDKSGFLDFLKENAENEKEKGEVLSGPEFKPVEGGLGEKQKLGEGIRFYGVWTEHLSERIREGQTALYFFPDGYAEEAQISLTDDPNNEKLFVLVVDPLTGEAKTEFEEPPIGTER